jgi:hypothetical protein
VDPVGIIFPLGNREEDFIKPELTTNPPEGKIVGVGVGVTPICPKPTINEASTPFIYEGITLCFL